MKFQLFIIGLIVGTFVQVDGLSEDEISERHHYRSGRRNKNHIAVTTDEEFKDIPIEENILIERAKEIGGQRYKRKAFAHNHGGHYSGHGDRMQYDTNGNIIQPWDPRFVHNCEYHNDCPTSTSTTTTTTRKPTVDPLMLLGPRIGAES